MNFGELLQPTLSLHFVTYTTYDPEQRSHIGSPRTETIRVGKRIYLVIYLHCEEIKTYIGSFYIYGECSQTLLLVMGGIPNQETKHTKMLFTMTVLNKSFKLTEQKENNHTFLIIYLHLISH